MSFQAVIADLGAALLQGSTLARTGSGDTRVYPDQKLDDKAGVSQKFDRSAQESAYVAALTSETDGDVAKLAQAKLESDALTGLRRDFVMRRQSRIAAIGLEASGKLLQGRRVSLIMPQVATRVGGV